MTAHGLSKKVAYGALADFYDALLTDKQRELLAMYCDEDLSLSEIAERTRISRQAVSEHLNRAYARLDALEAQLSLFERFRNMKAAVSACLDHLALVNATGGDAQYHLNQARDILRRHMNEEEA
ncbi:MAG: sigma factor-like helix-turn-helix DNA-binding protein [Eubacteriales bacterium]|nr:sigma factor-like helix-turn-helix DNA-binding protein [Eubacteriales bacterium]